MYNRICKKNCVLEKSTIKFITGVGGKDSHTLGQTLVPIIIGGLTLHQTFIVIPGAYEPQVILGKNFLYDQKATIDCSKGTGTLSLQQGMVSVRLENNSSKGDVNKVSLIRTRQDVIVTGQSECLLPVNVSSNNYSCEFGLIQPTLSLSRKWNVAGPQCAVSVSNKQSVYRLLNPFNSDSFIPKGTIIGTFRPANNAETSLVSIPAMPSEIAEKVVTKFKPLNPKAQEFIPNSNTCISVNYANIKHVDSDCMSVNTNVHNVCDPASCDYISRLLQYSEQSLNDTAENNQEHVLHVNEGTSEKNYVEIAKNLNVQVSETLPSLEKNKLLSVIGQNRDVFATSIEELGCYRDFKQVIDTGDSQPVKSRFYRVSPAQKLEIERQVKIFMEQGIVERSTSDWLSPVILVKKGDGTMRLVIDYRGLNKLVKPVYFPLPRHEDVIDTLGSKNASIFSTLDLAQAFLQTELDPKTKHKSAFITHHGIFQFTRAPYGLSNSPASFGIVMSKVLSEFNYVFALVYADDILVYSSDFDTHLKHLQQVFKKLREANLTLKPQKCSFAAKKVKFLGHIFSSEGVATDPDKTKAVDSFPTPQSVSDIKSFLGLCQYYKKFIKSFSNICAPLTALLRKDVKFVWDQKCEEAFKSLKASLTSSPILAYPKFDKEFILYTDASGTAISYILGQRNSDGKEVVISYGGRSLRDSERRWGITEKEGLAMIEGIRHYHVYLADRPFTVVTDHAALQYIQNNRMTSGRLSRWAIFLQQYRMNVVYKKGKLHSNADSLSRREYPPTTSPSNTWVMPINVHTLLTTDSERVPLLPAESKSSAEARYTQLNAGRYMAQVLNADTISVKEKQRADDNLNNIILYLENQTLPSDLSDEDLKRFIAESHEYVIDDDKLLYHLYTPRGKGLKADRIVKQLVVPSSLKHEILLSYHDSLLAGHQGFDRTYHLIRLKYFWLGMYNDIKRYVTSCIECQQNKTDKHSRHKAPLTPIPTDGIFKRIHIDLFGPLPQVNGFKYVLLVVDAFSKWTEAFPVKTLQGKEIAKILFREIICRWGAPYSLVSDRGTNFLSKIVVEVCKLFKIAKYKTTSWHPQCNGTAERRMATLAQTLRMFINKHQTNWPDILPAIMAAWRATPNMNSTMFSPYKLLLGEEMRLPIDVTLIPRDANPPDQYRHLEDLFEEFNVIHDLAKENIEQAQAQNKLYHDRKAVEPNFRLGDRVWINNQNKTVGLNPKLQPKYLGPYYVTDVSDTNTYELRDCVTHKKLKSRVNADRMKKFISDNDRNIVLNERDNTADDEAIAGPNITDQDNTVDQNVQVRADDPQPDTHTDLDLEPTPGTSGTDSQSSNGQPSVEPSTSTSSNPPSVQPNDDPTGVQSSCPDKQVETITKCSNYKGKKWYLTKWVNHKFKVWEVEDNIPQEAIRNFHIQYTQKGKARRAKRKSHS